MPRLIAESLALLLLVATLGFAVARSRGLPEAVVAVPAAALLLVLGVLPVAQAKAETKSLAPTIGFLAAVLVLADLCDRYGVFDAAGRWIAAGSRGRPVALLGLVFAVASTVTAVLSLDATVVLLTPVVFAMRPSPSSGLCCAGSSPPTWSAAESVTSRLRHAFRCLRSRSLR